MNEPKQSPLVFDRSHPLWKVAVDLWRELYPVEGDQFSTPENQERIGKIAAAIVAQHNWFVDYLTAAFQKGLGESTKKVTQREFLRGILSVLRYLRWELPDEAATPR